MKLKSQKINEGIETVINLSAHFARLKKQALKHAWDFDVQRRGYFLPEEDEKAMHLIVSYWQSRAALLELALSSNEEIRKKEMDEKEKLILFLIGYAATLVLVDSARFLKKNFDKMTVVRKRINQPNKAFGIPAGLYNKVQASLNDPKNLWHIYQANQLYEKNKRRLGKIAEKNKDLNKLLKIIKKLRRQARIKSLTFVQERLHGYGSQIYNFFKKPLKEQLYEAQESVSRMISFMRIKPWHQPHLPTKIAQKINQLIEPGDVLITRKEYAMTNYFLPGYWKHAALFLGDSKQLKALGLKDHKKLKGRWEEIEKLDEKQPLRVLESLKDGVHIRSIETPFSCDAIVIIRPKLTTENIAKALKRSLFHEGKPYDFDFDFTRSDRLVCTELIYRSYQGVGDMHFELSRRAGRLNLSAEDILKMALERNLFEPIAAYCPDKSKTIHLSEKVDPILKATIAI